MDHPHEERKKNTKPIDKFTFSFNLNQETKISKKIVKKKQVPKTSKKKTIAEPGLYTKPVPSLKDTILSLDYFQQVYSEFLVEQLLNSTLTISNEYSCACSIENKF